MSSQPNRWSLLSDYSKTVITLSSALLALSVTFAEKIVQVTAGTQIPVLLYAVWLFLVISILSGLLVAAFTYKYLEAVDINTNNKEEYEKRAHNMANAAYIFLGLAVIGLFLLGVIPSQRSFGALESVDMARSAVAAIEGFAESDLVVTSLEVNQQSETSKVILEHMENRAVYTITINMNDRSLLSLKGEEH